MADMVGIIADIHSNLAALQRALDIFEAEFVGRIVVCGDVVGYGGDLLINAVKGFVPWTARWWQATMIGRWRG